MSYVRRASAKVTIVMTVARPKRLIQHSSDARKQHEAQKCEDCYEDGVPRVPHPRNCRHFSGAQQEALKW